MFLNLLFDIYWLFLYVIVDNENICLCINIVDNSFNNINLGGVLECFKRIIFILEV